MTSRKLLRALLGIAVAAGVPAALRAQGGASPAPGQTVTPAPLVVRILDVGQGDAILIENGGSRVLVDGGPEPAALARKLDEYGVRATNLDVVILTHGHADHSGGLRAVFESRRRLAVRFFFDNRDASAGSGLATLRDSVLARAARHELVWRDTDDPCADGRPVCTITLRGGARLRILRPDPHPHGGTGDQNDRSVALKLLAPDSSRFTMWLAGDAEREELAWFDAAGYGRDPGMGADVLKADHHGSCNGLTPQYLAEVHPTWVVASLAAHNGFGHMHEQTKALLRARHIPWYRTDANGDITVNVPTGGPDRFTISPARGPASADGPSDRYCRSSTSTGHENVAGRRRPSRR